MNDNKRPCPQLLLGIFGCLSLLATLAWATEKETQNSRTLRHDFETVWKASLRVLQDHGEPLLNTDKSDGVMTTDWMREGRLRHKFSLLVTKSSESETGVSVNYLVEKQSRGPGMPWRAQKSDGKREKELLDEIERAVGTQSGR